MGLTKSERHNRMMDRAFEQYEKNEKDPAIKSFKRHQVKVGKAHPYKGSQYPGVTPKYKALKKRTGTVEKHQPYTNLKNRGGEFQ